MFNRKKKLEATPEVHTLLRGGTIWKGDIHSGPHSLRIECMVEGTIHSEGEVTIAHSGIVKGTIHARHLIVTGRAKGVFKVTECLEIHRTGWVDGDAEVGSLLVDEGGTLQGSCTRLGVNKVKEVKEVKEEPVTPTTKPSKRGKRGSGHGSRPVKESAAHPLTPFWSLVDQDQAEDHAAVTPWQFSEPEVMANS